MIFRAFSIELLSVSNAELILGHFSDHIFASRRVSIYVTRMHENFGDTTEYLVGIKDKIEYIICEINHNFRAQ